MRLDQIVGDVWAIPAEQMKGRRDATSEFRVPLSRQALTTVASASSFARNGYLFPGQRSGVISDATMGKYLKTRTIDAVPHGFRTSLRVWLAECSNAPHEVAETVMAHVSGSKVVRSYQRSDFLEKRRTLMQEWADFVTSTVL
jgi:integrase